MKNITIIMYHYVRPIKGSSYPLIKGLELDEFKTQLNFLEKTVSPPPRKILYFFCSWFKDFDIFDKFNLEKLFLFPDPEIK